MPAAKTKPTAAAGSDPAAETARPVPLADVAPSPWQARKTFDPDELARLADSIREHGVLQPVVVRPVKGVHHEWSVSPANSAAQLYTVWPNHRMPAADDRHVVGADAARALADLLSRDHFELVCGERRCRASRLAGKSHVPALVRELSDKAAAEAGVIENDQRADVPPLEQAEGYARLLAMGDDVGTIAAKIGRPEKYVVNRLTLTKLVPELQEEMRSGVLPFGHAHLLARLTPADQVRIAEHHLYDYQDVAVPLDRLRRAVRESAVLCLSAAPWKKDDATLTPAGACTACPRRTGSNPTLFDELLNGDAGKKGRDFCTDPACYEQKRVAFVELQVRKAADQAPAGEAPLKLTTEFWSRDKELLTADRYEVVSKKEARQAKPGELRTAVIVEGRGTDQVGKVVQVRVKKEPRPSTSGGSDSYARQQAAAKKAAEARRAAGLKANGMVAAKAELAYRAIADSPSMMLLLLRPLVGRLGEALWSDACRLFCKRRELVQKGRSDRDAVTTAANNSDDAAELFGMVCELVASRFSFDWGAMYHSGSMGADERAFWAAFGVDKSKLVREAEAERREKAGPKKAKAKGKKRKAGASHG